MMCLKPAFFSSKRDHNSSLGWISQDLAVLTQAKGEQVASSSSQDHGETVFGPMPSDRSPKVMGKQKSQARKKRK
jgi:hypothetical protein